MDAEELTWWRAQEVIDPWGQRREDKRLSFLCAVVMNARGPKESDKQGKAIAWWTPSDFEFVFKSAEKQTPQQTAAQIEHHMSVWVKAHNAQWEWQEKRDQWIREITEE